MQSSRSGRTSFAVPHHTEGPELGIDQRLKALEETVQRLRSRKKPNRPRNNIPLVEERSPHTRQATGDGPDVFWKRLNLEIDALWDDYPESFNQDTAGLPVLPSSQNAASTHQDQQTSSFDHDLNRLSLREYHPTVPHAEILWSVYQESVEALLKIVHVPTVRGVMLAAQRDPASLTPQNEALVFAIYFSAAVSMEEDQVRTQLSSDRTALFKSYRFALETCLAQADFLSTSHLPALQALSLFVIVARRIDDTLFCWSLTGLVVRMAQRMGLHRDGSHEGLTPYETQMRRRIWWDILVLDHRSAEEAGSDLLIAEDTFDTQMPCNINDADFDLQTVGMPQPREGRTDTSMALSRYEIMAISRGLAVEKLSEDGLRLAAYERMLVDAYDRIEKRFIKCPMYETDPMWLAVSLTVRIIVMKASLRLYESKIYSGSQSGLGEYANDMTRLRIFTAAIETVELGNVLYMDDRWKPYRWLFMTYTNWHAIALILIELCRRPWSALVERAWVSVEDFDTHPMGLLKGSRRSAMLLPLRKLRNRARKHRVSELSRLGGDIEACRRLDNAERRTTASAGFSSSFGSGGRLEAMRLRWWALMQQKLEQPPKDRNNQAQVEDGATQVEIDVAASSTLVPSNSQKGDGTICLRDLVLGNKTATDSSLHHHTK